MSKNLFHYLPDELVSFISSFISLNDLLSFALTCRKNHRCASDRLDLQVLYHKQYAVQHDRQPLTILELLRRATSGKEDTEPLWHIRTLEFWDGRLNWSQWKTTAFPFHFTDEDDDVEGEDGNDWYSWYKLDPAQDYSHYTAGCFEATELECYRNNFQNDLALTPQETEEWITSLLKGDDEPLKALLISQLPNLKTLTMFAHPEYEYTQAGHPLTLLNQTIKNLQTKPQTPSGPTWPAGLNSLTKLSINKFLSGEYEDFRHPHDAYYCPFSAIARFFHLPSIKSLSFSVAGCEDNNNNDGLGYLLPRACSLVEDLTFYCCCLMQNSAFENMVFSARMLRSLTTTEELSEAFRSKMMMVFPEYVVQKM
ncbi:Hypothetical protein R9X50_00579200 [Acrodontium crateriforme]|uniref:F-box domain-containing protein n=1 Tax=Acrodontium crateriforme TaxID=150365 RepID=A0AAQ3M6U8_9PEZI|nr:Hypothetical protein R9X50_00579200 [Acrodontium crateriforme]